jgi:hypothetical protein
LHIENLRALAEELRQMSGELFDHPIWKERHERTAPPKVTQYYVHHKPFDPKELGPLMFVNIGEDNKIVPPNTTPTMTHHDLGLDETARAHLFYPWLFHHHGYFDLVGQDKNGNPIRAPTAIEGAIVIIHMIENRVINWAVAKTAIT